MSPVTTLKAQHLVDPAKARKQVLDTMKRCNGNAHMAASELDCSYHTLWRLIAQDEQLRSEIVKLRLELDAAGVSQKGWSSE